MELKETLIFASLVFQESIARRRIASKLFIASPKKIIQEKIRNSTHFDKTSQKQTKKNLTVNNNKYIIIRRKK